MKSKISAKITKTIFTCCLMTLPQLAEASQYFDGGGDNQNMTTANNWTDDNTPSTGSGTDLHFQYNSGQQYCWYDYGNWDDWRAIYFDSDLTKYFKWRNTGVGIDLYGNNNIFIENNSSYGCDFEPQVSLHGSTPIVKSDSSQLVFQSDMYLQESSTLHLQGGNNNYIFFNGPIHGSAGLTLDSSFMNIQFSNTGNDYTGQTSINYGQLICGADGVIPDVSRLYINTNGVFNKNQKAESVASIAGSGIIKLGASGGNLTYAGNASDIFSGSITGGCNVVKQGTGTWTLGGDNSDMTGKFIIEGGSIKMSANNNLGADPSSVVSDYITLTNGAVLWATNTFTLNSKKGIELTGNGKISVSDTKTLSYSGEITGGNEFLKRGLGTLALGSSSDIIASQIYIDAGTLWVKHTQPFDGTATTINLGATSGTDPATLKLGSGSATKTIDESITIRSGSSGIKTIANGNTGNNCTFAGKVNLNDSLTLDASSGSTIVLSGGLDMSATGNNDLTITGSDDVTISGAIEADTGAAEINHNGTGTLLISADNASTVDNQMMINIGSTGTVQVDDSDGLGDNPTGAYPDKINFHDSGTLYNTVDIDLTSDAGITISNGVTATLKTGDGSTDDLKVNGVISDGTSNDGQLKMTGAGVLYLLGTNTYGGATTIESGTVRIEDDSALGTPPTSETDSHLVINGGTLLVPKSVTINVNRNIELGSSNGTFEQLSAKTLTINSKIKGAGNLTKTGAGNLVMASTGDNTYTGSTTISNGTIRITDDAALGTPPASAAAAHLTLDGGKLYAYDNVTLNSNRGIQLNANGGTIRVKSNKTLDYAGIIAGTGSLTKELSGTLKLGGVNTYNGATTINSGTIIVNGSAANSAFTVDSGTTLMGSGTIGDVTVNGTINPGNNAVGELTTGSLTMNNNSIFTCELGDCSGNTDRDFIHNNGTATINATVTIDLNDGKVSNWDNTVSQSWIIIEGGITATANFSLDETNWNLAKDGGVFSLSTSSGNLVLDYTAAATAPIIDTPTVTAITTSTATLGATLQANGNATVTDYGVVWGTATAPTTADNKIQKSTTEPSMPETFTVSASGLPVATNIYYRGYAINSEGTAYSTEDSFFTLSTEPAAQVTGFITTNYTGTIETRLELSWDEVATADGYIILRSTTAEPDGTPVDGTAYSAGDSLGNGAVAAIIPAGDTVTYQNDSLTADTHYYYKIIPFGYDGSNAGTYNYLTSGTPATSDTWTLADIPTSSASGITFTAVGSTSMTVNWTKGTASDYTLVAMSTSSSISNPKNRKGYSASSVYGNGETTGANDYIIYAGSGTSVTVTGLTAETTYYVELSPFNGSTPVSYQYKTTSPGTGNQATTATPSGPQMTIFLFK